MSISEASTSLGSVFTMLLVISFEVFLSRKNPSFHFQAVFINIWAIQEAFQTLENTARAREKVHEVQTYQVESNSEPPGIAQTDPPKKSFKFPPFEIRD
jgi:hypothetical protein